jgi:tetratricopeptide (TPR) repeat protein
VRDAVKCDETVGWRSLTEVQLKTHPWLVLGLLLLGVPQALAQAPALTLPDASPEATVTQRVGLTDITIAYHRPAVGKRKIWGDLVPYGEVWRAGANLNTTIRFSSPVTIGGKTVAAGTYGLHMLPTEKDWTVILSSVASAWGSFSYDAKEDVVRLNATPAPAGFEESLEYRFENPTENSVTVVLHWEKLQVPFAISVDTKAVTLASLQAQLRGLGRFYWQDWSQAAQWCLQNDCDVEQGLAWADRSIAMQPSFQNLRTKAAFLEKKGDTKAAGELRSRALKLATEADLNIAAYQLLAQKKVDEALVLFRRNVKEHPESSNVYDSLGEALAATGDKKGAIENYTKALSISADPGDKRRITAILAKLKA